MMNHKTNVHFIDSHSKRVCSADNLKYLQLHNSLALENLTRTLTSLYQSDIGNYGLAVVFIAEYFVLSQRKRQSMRVQKVLF